MVSFRLIFAEMTVVNNSAIGYEIYMGNKISKGTECSGDGFTALTRGIQMFPMRVAFVNKGWSLFFLTN